MTDERKPQSPPGGPQSPEQRQQQKGRQDKEQTGKEHMGNKPRDPSRIDQGQVGRDTDGDGKVVQPGQPPGQSHGTGHIKK
jgi:hypothetical protein